MSRTTGRKKYRVTNRVRFAAFIVISLLMICTITNTVLGFNDATALTEQQYIEIIVEPGDTLWSIADEYMDNNMDPREAVYMICDANEITADQLYIGQTLQIPVL